MNEQNWTSNDREGQVQLPSGQSLYLKASGPPGTHSSTPAIILIHGLGGTSTEWLSVQNLCSKFARTYLYERGGYHGSDPPLKDPAPSNIAIELREILQAAGVAPPYLLVGHSYGGVLARQFLASYPSSVSGMVIVDSAPVARKFPDAWTKMLGDASYWDVVGISANLGIPSSDWETIERETEINEAPGGIAERELSLISPNNQMLDDSLRGKQLLGDGRLCVIFCNESIDFGKVYSHGVAHGHGTAEDREVVREHWEGMLAYDEAAQRTQLDLVGEGGVARFVRAEEVRATHNVHLVNPGWVAQQIRWVFDGSEPE